MPGMGLPAIDIWCNPRQGIAGSTRAERSPEFRLAIPLLKFQINPDISGSAPAYKRILESRKKPRRSQRGETTDSALIFSPLQAGTRRFFGREPSRTLIAVIRQKTIIGELFSLRKSVILIRLM